jgi:hypothetical protein
VVQVPDLVEGPVVADGNGRSGRGHGGVRRHGGKGKAGVRIAREPIPDRRSPFPSGQDRNRAATAGERTLDPLR